MTSAIQEHEADLQVFEQHTKQADKADEDSDMLAAEMFQMQLEVAAKQVRLVLSTLTHSCWVVLTHFVIGNCAMQSDCSRMKGDLTVLAESCKDITEAMTASK